MEGLLEQLGINWQLLLSQAVNFFILLLILRAFVYKPLLKLMHDRQLRIQGGLNKANEADVRLREIDEIAKDKLKEADRQSMQLIKHTQMRAKELEQTLQAKAEQEQQNLLEQIRSSHAKAQEQARVEVLKHAAELVKKVIVKTVELDPKAVDEALIKKAALELTEE